MNVDKIWTYALNIILGVLLVAASALATHVILLEFANK